MIRRVFLATLALIPLLAPASAYGLDFAEKVPRGDSRTYRFYILDSAGSRIDLTGWTVVARYRRSLTEAPTTFTCPLDSDPTYAVVTTPVDLAATQGVVLVSVTATKAGQGPFTAVGTITVIEHG